jgi:hypothetical protein
MSVGLFAYPEQAAFRRNLPKTKIYEHTQLTTPVRNKLVSQIEKIVWQYKLSPETVNLPPKKTAPEIQVFTVTLKKPDISIEVLRAIDTAIPFPIIHELIYDGRVKVVVAFKRPSEADSSKWVTEIYFESDWQKLDAKRKPLPVAVDLGRLYQQILRELITVQPRQGENIAEHVQRVAVIRSKQSEAAKLDARLKKEKQFNRKVEINAQLRRLRIEIEVLSKPGAQSEQSQPLRR